MFCSFEYNCRSRTEFDLLFYMQQGDFLLIVLKKLIEKQSMDSIHKLKVILMYGCHLDIGISCDFNIRYLLFIIYLVICFTNMCCSL